MNVQQQNPEKFDPTKLPLEQQLEFIAKAEQVLVAILARRLAAARSGCAGVVAREVPPPSVN